jgi:hypothetical protein
MTMRYRMVAAIALFAIIGVAGFQANLVRQRRNELDALAMRRTQLAREISGARKSLGATERDLAQAERQLADLTPAVDANLVPDRRGEIDEWLARVKRLRGLFDEQPSQRIPELKLLTDADWLRLAKAARFDSDLEIRKTMAQVRTVAARLFADRLRMALGKFIRANGTPAPQTILSVASYFDPPIDPAILERYEIVPLSHSIPHGPAEWQVQNKSPVDADYDDRYVVTGGGWESSSGPTAWITNFRERYSQAAKAYSDANKTAASRTIEPVLPYFDPPLDPNQAAQLLTSEREHLLRLPPPMPR